MLISPVDRSQEGAVMSLLASLEMLPPEGLTMMGELLGEWLAGSSGEGAAGPGGVAQESLWMSAGLDGRLVGLAYCRVEPMADRVWNLLFLGVASESRRRGVGRALLAGVEEAVRVREGRLLIVETSGTPTYEPARRLYPRAGFELEGKVRDYYAAGDDKWVFRKLLRRA